MRGDLGLSPARERRAERRVRPARLEIPSLVGLGIDRDSPEGRQAQLFAKVLIAAIDAWGHREKRRHEGWKP